MDFSATDIWLDESIPIAESVPGLDTKRGIKKRRAGEAFVEFDVCFDVDSSLLTSPHTDTPAKSTDMVMSETPRPTNQAPPKVKSGTKTPRTPLCVLSPSNITPAKKLHCSADANPGSHRKSPVRTVCVASSTRMSSSKKPTQENSAGLDDDPWSLQISPPDTTIIRYIAKPKQPVQSPPRKSRTPTAGKDDPFALDV